MTEASQTELQTIQDSVRTTLQACIESVNDDQLLTLFSHINAFAVSWLAESPKKCVSTEMKCLFSAASALISQRLHSPASDLFLANLAAILESAQKENNDYCISGLAGLPAGRLHVTATGGERGCRTLYVTIATGLICSHFLPTIVQGNYSVTGCNCGSFAESDMMECMNYQLGSSKHDIERLVNDNFAYLHVQRYHPILKVFCSERGALGFRDMMKLAVVLADPFCCQHQYIGVWDKVLMSPMATAHKHRKCVTSSVIVASDHIDEFTDSAVININGVISSLDGLSIAKVTQDVNLQSIENTADAQQAVKDECEVIKSFFDADWSNPSPKLELVLQNTALALAASQDRNFSNNPSESIASCRTILVSKQEDIKKHCLSLINGWGSYHGLPRAV